MGINMITFKKIGLVLFKIFKFLLKITLGLAVLAIYFAIRFVIHVIVTAISNAQEI